MHHIFSCFLYFLLITLHFYPPSVPTIHILTSLAWHWRLFFNLYFYCIFLPCTTSSPPWRGRLFFYFSFIQFLYFLNFFLSLFSPLYCKSFSPPWRGRRTAFQCSALLRSSAAVRSVVWGVTILSYYYNRLSSLSFWIIMISLWLWVFKISHDSEVFMQFWYNLLFFKIRKTLTVEWSWDLSQRDGTIPKISQNPKAWYNLQDHTEYHQDQT